MILNDFTAPKEKFSREKLDAVLSELCGLLVDKQDENPDFYGKVAAAVLDPHGQLVTGVNYLYGDERVHAERAAIDKYEQEYGELPKGSIVITTLSPCSQDTGDNRQGCSCTDMLNHKGVKLAYCGYKDHTQEDRNKFTVIITQDESLKELCKSFADEILSENFADGKGPGRPGDSQRHGISKGASMSELEKASHASGRKGQLARWQLNMRRGKKKTNEVITNPNVKTKGANNANLVNKGEPVPAGKEQKLLGTRVGKLGQLEVYKWDQGNDSAYSIFNPQTRVSQLTVSGHNKAHAFEIFGVYAGPEAPVKAADLYAWLVKNQGLTLLSDKQQSPGGHRVWQDLEQRYGRSVNVYAYNMKTNQAINTGADDPESTHGTRGDIAQNVRLVAAPK